MSGLEVWLGLLLLAVVVFLFYILVIQRILHRGKKVPCPASEAGLFNTRWRRVYQPPWMIVKGLGLRPGMTVLELGPGTGAFTVDAAKAILPGGRLYALDIQQEMLDILVNTLRKEGVQNVTPMLGDIMEGIPLEPDSVDAVFGVTVLPEIPDPTQALKHVKNVLKRGGLFATGEIFLDPDFPLRRTVKHWAEEAGLVFTGGFGNPLRYVLVFQKGHET